MQKCLSMKEIVKIALKVIHIVELVIKSSFTNI